MRIVFCGTPEFAVPSLRPLLADPEFTIEAVVTQPDRPRGRGQRVSASPVKEVAAEARRADLSAGKDQVGLGAAIFSRRSSRTPWSSSPTGRSFRGA